MAEEITKVTGDTVQADFNAINTVLHYTRAAHFIGLWKSERALIEHYFPDKNARLLEAGCGAGRVAVGLWHQGYRRIVAFDFASELVEQAQNLAQEQGITDITFFQADATQPILPKLQISNAKSQTPSPNSDLQTPISDPFSANSGATALDAGLSTLDSTDSAFDGALFMFNGLMQIPGRENRRRAMRQLHTVCRNGAYFIFTTHDRDDPADIKEWAKEAARWAKGEQDARLHEFGDRYFSDETGNTFMHLPNRTEILDDLTATGWTHEQDRTRNDLASETPKVRNFSDNCRFWVARKNR